MWCFCGWCWVNPCFPFKSILLLNAVNLSTIRIGFALVPEQKGFWNQDLLLNSGTNIHRQKNLNCVPCIIIYIGQFTNTAISRPLCDKMECLCRALKIFSSSPNWALFSTKSYCQHWQLISTVWHTSSYNRYRYGKRCREVKILSHNTGCTVRV